MSERGEYRAIRRVLLDGPDFQKLPERARWMFIALKLNLGPSGIDVFYTDALVAMLAAQTGADAPKIREALNALAKAGWIEREGNVLLLVGHLENDPHIKKNDAKHRIGIQRHVAGLPRLEIVKRYIRARPDWFPEQECHVQGLGWAFAEPPKPLPSRDNEREKENETDSSRPAADAEVEETPNDEPPFALGPYVLVHRERFDADPPPGRYGKVLKRMESKYGPAEVFRRWKIFTHAKGELGPEYFERTWRDWDKPPLVKPGRNGATPEDDDRMRWTRLKQRIDERKQEEDGEEWWSRLEQEAKRRGAKNYRDVLLFAEQALEGAAA